MAAVGQVWYLIVLIPDLCTLTYFNRCTCGFGTIQSNMPPAPLEIKEKTYLTDAPPSDMPTRTVKLYQPILLHCQYNIHAV